MLMVVDGNVLYFKASIRNGCGILSIETQWCIDSNSSDSRRTDILNRRCGKAKAEWEKTKTKKQNEPGKRNGEKNTTNNIVVVVLHHHHWTFDLQACCMRNGCIYAAHTMFIVCSLIIIIQVQREINSIIDIVCQILTSNAFEPELDTDSTRAQM